MLRNYFKIAARKLKANKTQSFINIAGLSLGITISCLLLIYIFHELNYDSFHEKSERIHRIVEIDNSGDNTRYYGQTAPAVGSTLADQLPEVEAAVRLFRFIGQVNIEQNGQKYSERNWYVTDDKFFEVFDFSLVHGNTETALEEPNSAVISKSMAVKLFGREDVIGEVLNFEDNEDAVVTGVLNDIPKNSHLKFDILLSKNTAMDFWDEYIVRWDRYGAYTYLLTKENTDLQALNSKVASVVNEQWQEIADRSGVYLQPVIDIYLHSENVEFGLEQEKGQPFYINLFIGCAIFVLLIAGINYTNLATANSFSNTKEIGVRKVSGALKNQLVGQFLMEAIITALFAFLISILLIDLFMPYLNMITGKEFVFNFSTVGYYLGILFVVTIGIGLISGLYPAIYLSGINPSKNFKTAKNSKKGFLSLREGLVVTQFALSTILIVATIIGFQQMNYIQNKDKGFDEEQVLVVDINSGEVRQRFQTMKAEFEKVPGVTKVAASSRVPGEWKSITEIVAKPIFNQTNDSLQSYFMSFDKQVIDLYNIELIEGGNFRGNSGTDSSKVILNETAVQLLGLENPIGSQIEITGVSYPYTVIGIVKDFNFQSLHTRIEPLVIGYWDNAVRSIDYFSIKTSGNNISEILAGVTAVHNQFDPVSQIEYHFLDQQLQLFYQSDQRANNLFTIGAIFTILIACMGLFGLTLHMVEIQKKSIGIRKTLGASVQSIVLLLSKNFMKLIGIALLIASPIAYFTMDKWLNSFAYSINPSIVTFITAGIIILIVSLLTISFESVKAAKANPVESLKSE